ncbi:unnamed protein product, partial [Scytosiphon promiscuus]
METRTEIGVDWLSRPLSAPQKSLFSLRSFLRALEKHRPCVARSGACLPPGRFEELPEPFLVAHGIVPNAVYVVCCLLFDYAGRVQRGWFVGVTATTAADGTHVAGRTHSRDKPRGECIPSPSADCPKSRGCGAAARGGPDDFREEQIRSFVSYAFSCAACPRLCPFRALRSKKAVALTGVPPTSGSHASPARPPLSRSRRARWPRSPEPPTGHRRLETRMLTRKQLPSQTCHLRQRHQQQR